MKQQRERQQPSPPLEKAKDSLSLLQAPHEKQLMGFRLSSLPLLPTVRVQQARGRA